jgi:hypothetical protein
MFVCPLAKWAGNFLARARFTDAHCGIAANILGKSKEDFRKSAVQTVRALASDSAEWASRWRSVASYVLGETLGQDGTRAATVQLFHEMGFVCDDAWLTSDGTHPPTVRIGVPQVAYPKIVIDTEAQKQISTSFSGCYALYRPHGSNEGVLVRELFWIDEEYTLNHRSALLNRNGSLYMGATYKSSLVLYSYLFRPHPEFGFSARLISVATPGNSGKRALGGVIYFAPLLQPLLQRVHLGLLRRPLRRSRCAGGTAGSARASPGSAWTA